MKLNEIKRIHQFTIFNKMVKFNDYLEKFSDVRDIVKKYALEEQMSGTEFRQLKSATVIDDSVQGKLPWNKVYDKFIIPNISVMIRMPLSEDFKFFNPLNADTYYFNFQIDKDPEARIKTLCYTRSSKRVLFLEPNQILIEIRSSDLLQQVRKDIDKYGPEEGRLPFSHSEIAGMLVFK